MRIVVIGGTGHIGSYLTPMLAQVGCEAVCVCRKQRQPYVASDAWTGVRFHILDRDVREAEGAFGGDIADLSPDVVIDLTCYRPESAQQLAEALRGRVEHFLHCGTIWVHGSSVEVPSTEDSQSPPVGDYGIRKKAIEGYLLEQARSRSFPATILHPGHLVGPGWNPINPAGNFNAAVFSAIARGEPIQLPNLGMETLHHVHCADVASAFIAAIARRDAAIGQSFHVVAPRAVTMRGYAASVAGWFGREPNVSFLPWVEWAQTVDEIDAAITWDHLIHSPNCSIGKARRLLGYEPRYTGLAAVRESVDWLIANGKVAVN